METQAQLLGVFSARLSTCGDDTTRRQQQRWEMGIAAGPALRTVLTPDFPTRNFSRSPEVSREPHAQEPSVGSTGPVHALTAGTAVSASRLRHVSLGCAAGAGSRRPADLLPGRLKRQEEAVQRKGGLLKPCVSLLVSICLPCIYLSVKTADWIIWIMRIQ